jgi:EF hand
VWRYTLCVTVLFGMAAGGCGRPAPPPPSSAKLAPPPVRTTAGESPPEKLKADLATEDSTAVEMDSPSREPEDASKATDDERKMADAAGRERIALLTPGGPLIVDVSVTIDGRSHSAVFDERVNKVLEAAGATEDEGKPTWEALAANEDFLATQQTNQPSGSSQLKMWVEQYDENRDGEIQTAEAAAWLGRDAGRSASAFAVRSSRSYVSVPSAASRVWRLLDTDQSGSLSGDEIGSAAGKFWALDADDDRVISSAELATLREQLAAAGVATPAAPETARYAAIQIEPAMEADRLEYLLSDLYAPRQMLGPSSFPELADLYKKLDANGDDWLEQLELTDMVTTDPHLELAVSFGGPNETQRGTAALSVRHHVEEVDVLAIPSPNRVMLAVGSTRLIVSTHDLASNGEATQSAEPTQIRLMVHDQSDAVFEELDQNADGRLGEREIAASTNQLLARDANGDGQLAASELRYSMIVAFLRGEQPQEQSFYVPAFVPAGIATDSPMWFSKADFNADGDISRREFVGSFQHFAAVDENEDGFISREEAAAFDEKTPARSN